MRFGPEPVARAEGALLAHSVQAGKRKLRKGLLLGADEIAALQAAGIAEVTVARLEPGDVAEDAAAMQVASALVPGGHGVRLTRPQNGRVNLLADRPGVLRLDARAIHALNAVDPAITLATLPDLTRVSDAMMLATVKIIPYAVPGAALARAAAALGNAPVISVAPTELRTAELIVTRTPGFSDKLVDKGRRAVADRLAALGVRLVRDEVVPHETGAVAAALARTRAPLVLILGASATSDPADVCPAGLIAAGGTLTRFGMPVDPGNLLFLGRRAAAQVVGLPGCARSPALNGADWVLERLVCGIDVGDAEIAAMGVGGLLKEIPVRPQPRVIAPAPKAGAPVDVVLLAAGASRRMRGRDKLLETVAGAPLLRRAAEAALASRARRVLVVLPPDAGARAEALAGLAVETVIAETAAEGMGASLRTGIAALPEDSAGVIVALADMPEVDAAAFDALIAAYDPGRHREICRAAAPDGTPGHPVLFGRRFYESLQDLRGDTGARGIVAGAREYVFDVTLDSRAPLTDLDTPEDWAAWRALAD
ncbi:NTP transferase domain-containing protein [Rhodobacteraceae bacterium 2CG4]|uniref:NTP transferase domain-containing protein n=1 Tax=Halovulum marinum TaxID=2662447 RepID=A0A6L5Z4U1_9RHOB|nr:NTP transferase domain-containing protein [Halovulum marinum]